MRIKLTFLGAAKSVTGSRILVETDNLRFLIDCGLYQERELRIHNWERFPVTPSTIDAVVLTHAHIDHCGLLPKLVKEGFRNPVYCTAPTADIAKIMLLDSARLQAHDAELKKKRHERERRRGPYPEIPLYTEEEAEDSFVYFQPVEYQKTVKPAKGVEFTLHESGHVLGGAMVEVTIRDKRQKTRLIFSGDIGRWHRPILRDPTLFEAADYIITESTYANRNLPDPDEMLDQFIDVINTTVKDGGNVIIPSFALERAQDILYYLYKAREAGRLAPVKIYLDSPMAVSITDIFTKYSSLLDEEMRQLVRRRSSPFRFPGLHFVTSLEDSQRIGEQDSPSVIIAGSGMCTGGRVKFHLAANITRRESAILFVGYQSAGTLGRLLVDGAKDVRIMGERYPVKARVLQMYGLSSHADSAQLQRWLYNFKNTPKKVFVVHGEEESAEYYAGKIKQDKGWEAIVPEFGEEFVLD